MAEYKPLTDKEYQQLQKLYERALADEHAQLTARMRDDLVSITRKECMKRKCGGTDTICPMNTTGFMPKEVLT